MKIILKFKNLIFILFLFAIFHKQLISLYQEYIVNGILVMVSKSPVADFAILILAVLAIWWTAEKLKRGFYIKLENLILPSLVFLGYTFIRVFKAETLMGSWATEQLKYSDILYVFCTIPFVLKKWGIARTSTQKDIIYQHDSPISSKEEDILDRKNQSFQVYSILKSAPSNESFAIGIVGKWGEGKSSLMNLVKERFESDDNYVIVQFNSWLNISVESIVNDFFNTVEEKVAPFGLDVSKEIKNYGKNVLSVYRSSITDIALNTVGLFPEKSLTKNFEDLNKTFKRLNKKVLVFFDDLDRLQPNEVFAVLKLIRNMASFDVFNYIVGYDKDYLIEALEKNGIPNAEKYCDKIFLKEFPLLPVTEKVINNYLKNKLYELVPDKKEKIEELFDEINKRIDHNLPNVLSSIKNIRDAKRYLGEIAVLRGMEHEVEVKDFVLIKLLKFSYYEVYRMLFNKQKFIDERKDNTTKGYDKYYSYRLKQQEKKSSSGIRLNGYFPDSVLKAEIQNLRVYSEAHLVDIENMLNYIFSDGTFSRKTTSLSLAYGMNYFKYFRDEIDPLDFLKEDFDRFIKADFEIKRNIIASAKQKANFDGLMAFIYKIDFINELTSKIGYKNFVNILFYIAHLPGEKTRPYFGLDMEYLCGVLDNHDNRIVNSFQFSGESEFKNFIHDGFYSRLHSDAYQYNFDAHFLQDVLKKRGHNSELGIPFTKKEVIEYLEDCLRHKSKQVTGINETFWDCYNLCFITAWRSTGNNSFSGYAKSIETNLDVLKYDILPLFLDEYLIQLVVPDGEARNSQSKYGIDQNLGIKEIFGNTQNLIDYLKSEKISNFPSEFKDEFIEFARRVLQEPEGTDFMFKYELVIAKIREYNTGYKR